MIFHLRTFLHFTKTRQPNPPKPCYESRPGPLLPGPGRVGPGRAGPGRAGPGMAGLACHDHDAAGRGVPRRLSRGGMNRSGGSPSPSKVSSSKVTLEGLRQQPVTGFTLTLTC